MPTAGSTGIAKEIQSVVRSRVGKGHRTNKHKDGATTVKHAHGPLVNWVGVTTTNPIEHERTNPTQDIKIVSVVLNYGKDVQVTRVRFPEADQARHIHDRIADGRHIWFGQGVTQQAKHDPENEKMLRIAVFCKRTPDTCSTRMK